MLSNLLYLLTRLEESLHLLSVYILIQAEHNKWKEDMHRCEIRTCLLYGELLGTHFFPKYTTLLVSIPTRKFSNCCYLRFAKLYYVLNYKPLLIASIQPSPLHLSCLRTEGKMMFQPFNLMFASSISSSLPSRLMA